MEQKDAKQQPVLAICYDFDKTLSPDDMQAQGYIQSVNYDVDEFWKESNVLAENNDMDQNLAYMYKMLDSSEGVMVFNRKTLQEYGSRVKLFAGVEDWFDRICAYGQEHGVIVEHYIISCGLKEMIEGTSVAHAFKKIYASSFYYDENGVARWPAQVVNYTNKTQFLFRISKGVLDVNDQRVNDSFAPQDIRVPFRNMVYVGDSDTDVPCMKLVNSYNGHSIGVYNAQTQDKTKVHKMMRDGRIRYFAPADYTEGSPLDTLVKGIITATAGNEALQSRYYACRQDTAQADTESNAYEREKANAIIDLEESGSFARTHAVIAKLRTFADWTAQEKERLVQIGAKNSQVSCILSDADVKDFYQNIVQDLPSDWLDVQKIKAAMDKPKKKKR